MADRKLAIGAGTSPTLEGDGADLTLKFRAHRRKKTGTYDFYDVELKLERWFIQRLARQIAAMHVRDRKRLKGELERIDLEIDAIKQPDT